MEARKRIVVVGAVVLRDGLVLCAQRGAAKNLAGLWEFPGGKIEPGETPEAALRRELEEELGVTVSVGARIVTTVHEYDFGIVDLTTYYCEIAGGTIQATEHAELRWVAPAALSELTWAPADIPAIAAIQAELAHP